MGTKVIIKADKVSNSGHILPESVCSCPTLITYLVRGKIDFSVDINQLEGHGKVLVAVSCEGALGFGGIVHPGSLENYV